MPYPHSFIGRFYDSIGLRAPRLEYQKWGGPEPEMKLSPTPYLGCAEWHLLRNKIRPAKALGLAFGEKIGEQAPISAKARERRLRNFDSASDRTTGHRDIPETAISRRLDRSHSKTT